MSLEEVRARKQAWLNSAPDRLLKRQRATLRLVRTLRSALKHLGPRDTAQLLVDLFRENGYPTEIRRHL